jgi:hypothetical protein
MTHYEIDYIEQGGRAALYHAAADLWGHGLLLSGRYSDDTNRYLLRLMRAIEEGTVEWNRNGAFL